LYYVIFKHFNTTLDFFVVFFLKCKTSEAKKAITSECPMLVHMTTTK